MLAEVKAGEIKDTFHNPGYLREGALGMLSFDTKDFPWGDYRQHVYVKVLNNWLDRIPLAARQGMRGWLCLRFVIEKDGRVSEIRILRPSSVPPFDRAAEDALRASSAFAPLPDGFPGEREGITGCFIYNLLPDEIERF
jgi:TonB family protein